MRRAKRIVLELFTVLSLMLASTSVFAADKPNIVLILADNQIGRASCRERVYVLV